MKRYFKLNRFVVIALLLTSAGLLQAINNSPEANAEYRNTRKLFAALGLKHTNDLVIESREIQLMEACENKVLQNVLSEMGVVTGSGRLTVDEFKAVRKAMIEEPIRKDLKIKFINKKIGYGVFATNDMPVNTVIGVYSGRISSPEKTNQDYAFPFAGIIESEDEDILDPFHYVDASIYGNATRFINHSDDHNCNTITMFDKNQIPQIVFVTRDPIKKGEQITINYGDCYNWDKKAVKATVIISK